MPGVAAHGSTREKALEEVLSAARAACDVLGKDAPRPLAEFSGRFVVRVPPDLHRRLVVEAEERSISLNRWVSDKLAR